MTKRLFKCRKCVTIAVLNLFLFVYFLLIFDRKSNYIENEGLDQSYINTGKLLVFKIPALNIGKYKE